MDELAEMHLVLREAGWEPELGDPHGQEGPGWFWTLPAGDDTVIHTDNSQGRVECTEFPPMHPTLRFSTGREHTVASLRRRLKQLAEK